MDDRAGRRLCTGRSDLVSVVQVVVPVDDQVGLRTGDVPPRLAREVPLPSLGLHPRARLDGRVQHGQRGVLPVRHLHEREPAVAALRERLEARDVPPAACVGVVSERPLPASVLSDLAAGHAAPSELGILGEEHDAERCERCHVGLDEGVDVGEEVGRLDGVVVAVVDEQRVRADGEHGREVRPLRRERAAGVRGVVDR